MLWEITTGTDFICFGLKLSVPHEQFIVCDPYQLRDIQTNRISDRIMCKFPQNPSNIFLGLQQHQQQQTSKLFLQWNQVFCSSCDRWVWRVFLQKLKGLYWLSVVVRTRMMENMECCESYWCDCQSFLTCWHCDFPCDWFYSHTAFLDLL